jgi:glutaredoxin-like protein NrdH
MSQITVYSKPEDSIPKCYACESTKKWLDKEGLEYTVLDLTSDENTEYAKSLGHQQAPVVVVQHDDGTSESWSGFNPGKITALKN